VFGGKGLNEKTDLRGTILVPIRCGKLPNPPGAESEEVTAREIVIKKELGINLEPAHPT
jgi:hypothetical protein